MTQINPIRVLRVALPVPLPQLFDYLPPQPCAPVAAGVRVLVPFGKRKLVGIVVEDSPHTEVESGRLVPVLDILDQAQPLLDAPLMRLLGWCWQYYKHAPGEVLQTALPPALRKPEQSLPPPPLQYALTADGLERLQQGPGRATAQYALLQRLRDGPLLEAQLADEGGRWRATLARLMEQGWVAAEPAVAAQPRPQSGPSLTPEQERAVSAMAADLQHFQCHLLDGVTGSGKTEVYLQLLEQVLKQGRQGLVLVPEIGLTPQLIRRFQQRLGLPPAVLHSGLSQGERLQTWAAVASGRARLLIGTRSALFTPMPELGLMILDEEHDASFKQQDGFRYSARDVAVKRAAELDIPIVLGSATPSLETLNNALTGRYAHHRLRQRATRAAMPRWRVLDMAHHTTTQGLAAGSLQAMAQTLERGEQVMVFLNRRGYAPVLMCQQCGWHGSCDRCDSNLTWHRGARLLCCHHCGHQRRVPPLCPACRADALASAGEGTEQLEQALTQHFPAVPVLRFDRDSTSRKGSFDERLQQVRSGVPCILVGTQMLAKGHHFPSVTLVVVVNVDQALYSADFRARERLGQTLLQVSGRAGRAEKPGTVILQTFHPQDEQLVLLIDQGYEAFAGVLLKERSAAQLPPSSYQVMLRAEAHERQQVEAFLNRAAGCFPAGQGKVYGPLPAVMERVAGRYRMYLLVQADRRADLHRQVDEWLSQIRRLKEGRKVRWAIDMDPQEM